MFGRSDEGVVFALYGGDSVFRDRWRRQRSGGNVRAFPRWERGHRGRGSFPGGDYPILLILLLLHLERVVEVFLKAKV